MAIAVVALLVQSVQQVRIFVKFIAKMEPLTKISAPYADRYRQSMGVVILNQKVTSTSHSSINIYIYIYAGSFSTLLCPIGFICPKGGMSLPQVCPTGAYCNSSGLSAPQAQTLCLRLLDNISLIFFFSS